MTRTRKDEIPVITEEMMKKTATEMARRKKRFPLEGMMLECPACERGTMEYRKDLCFDIVLDGEHIVIPNLSGHKCKVCGDEAYDAESSHVISKYTSDRIPGGGHEASVTVVGGNQLGIYFPKDVLRVMRIHSKKKVIITPISRSKMILELEEVT